MYPLYPMYSHSTVVQHESTSLVVLDDDGDFVVEGVAVWQVGGAGREEREKGERERKIVHMQIDCQTE